MSNCSKHKKELAGISDMKVLAEMIGDLHYETLAELLTHLTDKLEDDCIRDKRAGRVCLATVLYEASKYIRFARFKISQAWQLSKPFMESITPQIMIMENKDALIPQKFLNWAGEEAVRISERTHCEFDAAISMAKETYRHLLPSPAIEGKDLKTDLERRVEKLERNPLTTIYGPPPRDPEEDSAELRAFIESAKKMPEGKFIPNQPSWSEGKEEEKWMPMHPDDIRKPGCQKRIPFSLLKNEQAFRNHSQSLDRLAERGGIGAIEAVAIIEGKSYADVHLTTESAIEWLNKKLAPTPPAGSEGEGEIDVWGMKIPTDAARWILRRLDRHYNLSGDYPHEYIAYRNAMEVAYLEMYNMMSNPTNQEWARHGKRVYDLIEQLCAAQAKIAELQARVNELQEWHDSHL